LQETLREKLGSKVEEPCEAGNEVPKGIIARSGERFEFETLGKIRRPMK